MSRRRPVWLLAIVLAALAMGIGITAALPDPQGAVNDFAGVLDTATRDHLTAMLQALEKDTTAEVAVATVSSLDGSTVEEYATALFNQWGIGQKDLDNGVLVLVAPDDRQVRIEVGYGLEPILPDGLAGEIIRQQFLPKFRNQDYSGGIRDGVERIAAIVRARHIVTDEERKALAAAEHKNDWIMVPFLSLFVAIGAMGVGLGARAKAIGPIVFGSFFGGMPLVMGWLLGPAWTGFVLGPFALGMAALGFRLGSRESWRSVVRTTHPSSGWVMGGGGVRSGSSSSSSSSRSFGGGSSGGGGASGRW